MAKRLNIGIYIGPNDHDIADWLNMLQANNLSRSSWVCGLLCAYSLDKPLSVGGISRNSNGFLTPCQIDVEENIIFGIGDSQNQFQVSTHTVGTFEGQIGLLLKAVLQIFLLADVKSLPS